MSARDPLFDTLFRPTTVAPAIASAAPVRAAGTRSRAGNAMNRTRAALLDGARRSVEVNGTKITMAQVAAAAGVAKATLYNHFRTREAVLSALLAAEVAKLVDEFAGQPLADALGGAANALAPPVVAHARPHRTGHPRRTRLHRLQRRRLAQRTRGRRRGAGHRLAGRHRHGAALAGVLPHHPGQPGLDRGRSRCRAQWPARRVRPACGPAGQSRLPRGAACLSADPCRPCRAGRASDTMKWSPDRRLPTPTRLEGT